MTSERHPYARPPGDVFVFAHVADEHGTDFVPAGSLEGANTTQPVFVYGKRYVQRPYAVEVDPVALPLKDEAGGAKRFVLAGLTEFGGIRDAAPDAWGRRVIENKLKVAGRCQGAVHPAIRPLLGSAWGRAKPRQRKLGAVGGA